MARTLDRGGHADVAADGAEEAKVHGVRDPQQATEELGFYDRLVPYAAEGSTGTKVYVGNGGAGGEVLGSPG